MLRASILIFSQINLRPTSIKRTADGQALDVLWDDGHASHFTLELFRRECPCARCKGEVIFGKVVLSPTVPIFQPGMNDLVSLVPTGQYGVQANWKDGHDSGIYSWEYLRLICPCEECSSRRRKMLEELERP